MWPRNSDYVIHVARGQPAPSQLPSRCYACAELVFDYESFRVPLRASSKRSRLFSRSSVPLDDNLQDYDMTPWSVAPWADFASESVLAPVSYCCPKLLEGTAPPFCFLRMICIKTRCDVFVSFCLLRIVAHKDTLVLSLWLRN